MLDRLLDEIATGVSNIMYRGEGLPDSFHEKVMVLLLSSRTRSRAGMPFHS